MQAPVARALPRRRGIGGFTYIGVLVIVAVMSAGLALVGEVWHTANVRAKEAELIHVGNAYRRAIQRYYLSGPPQYPRSLNDLLKDPRKITTERYLRRLYPDPMTGSTEWGLVRAPDGGIMGVYSRSERRPLKIANFRAADKTFERAARYADWKFVFAVEAGARERPPAAPGGAGVPATSATSPAPVQR